MGAMDCGVVVPTLRRPTQLLACLEGLARQTRTPREVLVVHTREDSETTHLLGGSLPLPVREVVVEGGGQVAALVAGTQLARAGIVAFIDDDAVPRPDWIEGLMTLYDLPGTGGAGGRDVVAGNEDGWTREVGCVRPTGVLVGNHHRGCGGVREVAVLKGVNCSYRREIVQFPMNLRGRGAQVAWEWGTGYQIRARGWRLLYDPDVIVDHFPGPRFDADQRGRPSGEAVADAAFNEAFIVGSFDPGLLLRRVITQTLVGSRSAPGLARCAWAAARTSRQQRIFWRWWPSTRGLYGALGAVARGRKVEFSPILAA